MPDDETVFYCHKCGEVAATVKITPGTVLVRFMGESQYWFKDAQLEPLRQIWPRGDQLEILKALAALDAELVSFHCPSCNLAYCAEHWHPQIQFDDDWAGWYDCTYGTCPQGHRHLLND